MVFHLPSQLPAKARPGAERPARYVEVGGSGGYGRMGLRPSGTEGRKSPAVAVAVAARVYILHLRESNPRKPGKRRQRRSAGGSR